MQSGVGGRACLSFSRSLVGSQCVALTLDDVADGDVDVGAVQHVRSAPGTVGVVEREGQDVAAVVDGELELQSE